MKDDVAKELKQFSLKTGLFSRLSKLHAQFQAHRRLPPNTVQVIDSLKRAQDDLNNIRAESEMAKETEIAGIFARHEELKTRLEDTTTAAKYVLGRLEYLKDRASKDQRSDYITNYNQASYYATNFEKHKFAAALSEALGKAIHGIESQPEKSCTAPDMLAVLVDPASHSDDRVCLYADGSHEIGKAFKTYFEAKRDVVKVALDETDAAMKDHEKWPGAYGNVTGMDSLAVPTVDSWKPENVMETWLVAVRRWKCRYGPSGFPLPGVGAWVHALDDMFFVVLSGQLILGKGIALPDLLNFLEQPTGLELFAKQGTMMKVNRHDTFWLPRGSVCIPMYVADKDSAGKNLFGRVLHIPDLDKSKRNLPAPVQKAFDDMNAKWLQLSAPKHQMYKARLDAYASFME